MQLVQNLDQTQTEVVATFLIISGARMNILFINYQSEDSRAH
jgi:hypothetical protein